MHSLHAVRLRPRHLQWCWPVHADTCSANGVALLRRPPSAASDPPIGACSHVPNAGGCAAYAFPTGLRKWCTCWPASQHTNMPSPFGSECVGTTEALRPSLVRYQALLTIRVRGALSIAVCVDVYKVLRGAAPCYIGLQGHSLVLPMCPVCEASALSARHNHLVVPPVKHSTVGSQAFPVATSLWNAVPEVWPRHQLYGLSSALYIGLYIVFSGPCSDFITQATFASFPCMVSLNY